MFFKNIKSHNQNIYIKDSSLCGGLGINKVTIH